MTLNQLNGVLRGAASIMASTERNARNAAAGRCTVTNLRDIQIVRKDAIPAYAWADQDKRGCIHAHLLAYWMYPWPRQYDKDGVIGYDHRLVPPYHGRRPAFPRVLRRELRG
jgi:hypothetical protein